MRSTYRAFAYIIAAEVAVQAAAVAFAFLGLGKWINDGGVLDKATMEDQSLSFTGSVGFMIHGLNGQMVIPFLALVLLILSFFAKVSGGAKWAAAILALVVIQVMLGIFGREIPVLGPFHGINAFLLFSVAVMAGRRVGSAKTERVVAEQHVPI